MNNEIAVSTFSLRHRLGPLRVGARSEDGESTTAPVGNWPTTMSLSDLPQILVSQFGVTAFELLDSYMLQMSKSDRATLSSAMKTHGVALSAVIVDTIFISPDPEQRRLDMDRLVDLMTVAAGLGARGVRVTLLPAGGMFTNEDAADEIGGAASFETIVATLREAGRSAAEIGLELYIENHCALTATPTAIASLLDAVGPTVGLLLDTGNFDPVMTESLDAYFDGRVPGDVDASQVYAAVEELLPRAKRVHIKNYGYHNDGRSRIYDLDRILEVVRLSGFAGTLTVESESEIGGGPAVDDDTRTTLNKIREMLVSE